MKIISTTTRLVIAIAFLGKTTATEPVGTEGLETCADEATDPLLPLDFAKPAGRVRALKESKPGRKLDEMTGPYVEQTFEGTSFDTSEQTYVFIPPDPMGAAGKFSLIAVVNSNIVLHNRNTGEIIQNSPMNAFFPSLPSIGDGTETGFDPKIVYDPHEDRFVVVCLAGKEFATSTILLAVSKTGNPATLNDEDWWFSNLPGGYNVTGNPSWSDYPGFEVDEEAVYITMILFGDNKFYQQTRLWVVDKGVGNSGFYEADDAVVVTGEFVTSDFFDGIIFMPALIRDPAGAGPGIGTYVCAYSGLHDGGGTSYVLCLRVDNPITAPSLVSLGFFPFGQIEANFVSLPDAPQPDIDNLIEVNDRRMLDMVWSDSSLWCVFTIASLSNSGETTAYWIKLQTDTSSGNILGVADQGEINGEDISTGSYTYFPAVAVNNNGIAAFGFSASSPTLYGGAYVAVRDDTNDLAGTVQAAETVKAGETSYVRTFGGSRNRWGDYTGMSNDPLDDDCFWAYNNFADAPCLDFGGEDGCWGTAWARLCVRRTPGASGDPHFKTWTGEYYDFHGLCDLVLLENSDFESGLGMDIHIRSKKMMHWSFISNAALRIGQDILEVKGDKTGEKIYHWMNGIAGEELGNSESSMLSQTISGYPITYKKLSSKQHELTVDLGNDESIVMKTFKQLVRVDIRGATRINFGNSTGLMGTFDKGLHMARDKETVLHDINDFGQEWQVLSEEPPLFQSREGQQAPQKCLLPSATDVKRRLAESGITYEEAMIACSRVNEKDRGVCIFDVMATGDKDVAGAY